MELDRYTEKAQQAILGAQRLATDAQSPVLDAEHLLAATAYAASPADVHHVLVGGRPIVVDGAHVDLDVPRELERSIEAFEPR